MNTLKTALVFAALSLLVAGCAVDVGGHLNADGAGTHGGFQLGTDHETGLGANLAGGVTRDGVNVDGGFGLSVGGQDLIHIGNTTK